MTESPLNQYPILRTGQSGRRERSKVALIGFGHTRPAAPLEDPTWEVWGLNQMVLLDAAGAFRADRWFEMHPPEAQSTSDWTFLHALPPALPIYTPGPFPAHLPQAVDFPLDAILMRFPGIDFFACTFAYQVALALWEGFTDIGLFGIDLERGSARERAVERASVAFWCGVALGADINLHIPGNCDLLHHPWRYGYDYDEEIAWVNAWLEPIAVQSAPWDAVETEDLA